MSERLIDSLPAVEACLRTSRRWLLGFGFDGTLSSIVDNPDAASLGPSVRESLAALSAPSRQVLAILSGRDRADLERRVALPNIIYAGNHGLDIRGPGFSFVEPTAATNQVLMNNLAAVMKEKLQGIEGIYVENKQLSIMPHPLSGVRSRRFMYPREAEIVGRVVAYHTRCVDTEPARDAKQ